MNRSGNSCVGVGVRVVYGLLCAAMLFFVLETPAQAQSLLTRHVRDGVTSGEAKFLNRLAPTQTLRIDIVLPLRDQAGLDKFLQEVYDPSSPSYRHFLTVPQFTARFGPTEEDYNAVIQYAESNGFKVVGGSRDGMDVQLEGSVTSIEAAFNVSMGLYQHPTENRSFYAADREPTIELPMHLWHVSGLDNYSLPRPALVHKDLIAAKPASTTGSGPSASFLGSDMRAAYYGTGSLTGTGQSLGMLEYYGTDLADLTTYFKNIGQTNGVPVTLLSTDGTSTSCVYSRGCDDTEQTLDMTQAIGMAPGLSALIVYVGSTDTAIFSSMSTHSPLNAQLSSSWTWSPADPTTDDPYFKKFAAQGQNLFQAAGDDGAYTTKTTEIYPADDDYVTAVGGTDLTTSSVAGPWSGETAWIDGGGGISPDRIAIPSWQQLAGVITSSNKGSTTYRNVPDVSANANFTFYVCADQTTCTANEYGGTSFAAPMWAGYLALANQQLYSTNSTTLGFINPTIYALGVSTAYDNDFHDITSGTNNGYSAIAGYDLATGWGSPNGAALITALVGGATTPNFTIAATSISVAQRSSGQSTVTTTAVNGFSGSISLSASNLPSNVTAGFNPTAIASSGTSALTLTVASSVATGTYTITVTGTSGSLVNSTTLTLTVTAAPSANFTIGVSPTTVTVTRSSSSSTTISTAAVNGFNSAISLAASGLPSGVTASFSPTSIAAPGNGTSTLKLTASSRATTGTRIVTITGTGGGKTNTTTISLTVNR